MKPGSTANRTFLGWGFMLMLMCASAIPAMAQTCVTPPAGIIAWWALDETSGTIAEDIGGNHPGVYFGGPTPVPGKVGGSLRFDGGNFIGVGDSDLWAFGTDNFTIELWVNFDAPGGGSIGHPGDIFIGNDEGPGSVNKWFFALGGGFLNFHINEPSVGSRFFPLVPFSPNVDQWYHLAVTRNGNTWTIFINGTPGGSDIDTRPVPNANASLTIGQAESLGFMNGRLDEITIYNRALTQEELQAIVNADSGGKCKTSTPITPSLLPSAGGDTGAVTVRITGNGFEEGALVKLIRTGEPDIVGNPITVGEGGTTITTTFDLTDKAHGLWDVVVINPNSPSVILPQAFTIEESHTAQGWVDVIGRGAIRFGQTTQFSVLYGNRGNLDASDVILWVAVPEGVTLTVDLPYLQNIGLPPQDPPVLHDGYTYFWFFTDKLSASSTHNFNLSLNSSILGQIEIRSGLFEGTSVLQSLSQQPVAFSEPTFREGLGLLPSPTSQLEALSIIPGYTDPQPGDTVFKLSDSTDPFPQPGHVGMHVGDGWVIDFVTKGAPIEEGYLRRIPLQYWALEPGTYRGSARPPGMSDTDAARAAQEAIQFYDDWVARGSPTLRYGIPPTANQDDCVSWLNDRYRASGYNPAWSDWSSPGSLYERMTGKHWPAFPQTVYRLPSEVTTLLCRQLPLLCLPLFVPIRVQVVGSYDPNDKVGSQGAGIGHYLSGDEPLRYGIFFENVETATAPAQEVIITDQLDTTNIDLSTLSLGPIAFGDHVITPPPGLNAFSTDVDLRPVKNLIVRIAINLNPTTGLLTWRLTSLDPATGQPPDDPFVGFLPPNVNPPEGDGSVVFTVRPKKGLPTGTEIRNSAEIVFDTNAPIETPDWFNTIDNDKPTSEVAGLDSTQPSANFQVVWSGTDVGSGIKDYTIFVSENSGPFTEWLSNTSATSANFTGQPVRNYAFYSVARDATGNVEDAPAVADAVTEVVVATNQPPVAKCRNVTVVANNLCQATADVNDGSYDPEGGQITLNQSPAGPYGLGNTLVTLTATDAQGASSSCTATVTVEDNTPPALTCPQPQVVECTGPAGASVTFNPPVATDNCSAVVPVCNPPSGSTFPLGTTADTCTTTDERGNTSSCTFTVQVLTGDACDGDADNDGIPDATDNCPAIANPNQADGDGDGIGNVCDNCPTKANAAQTDTDKDGIGNPCDPDENGDGILDGDLNGDNKVDVNDYKVFQGAFGKCKGNPKYNPKADYDNDGCITLVDYQIWYQYYKKNKS